MDEEEFEAKYCAIPYEQWDANRNITEGLKYSIKNLRKIRREILQRKEINPKALEERMNI